MKKKLLILTLAITLGLAACGSKTETKDNTPVSSSAAGSKETTADATVENKTSSSVSTKESIVENTTKEEKKEKTTGEEIWGNKGTNNPLKFTASVPVSEKEYNVYFTYNEGDMSKYTDEDIFYAFGGQAYDPLFVKEGRYSGSVHKIWGEKNKVGSEQENIEFVYVGYGKNKDDGISTVLSLRLKTDKELGYVFTEEEIDDVVADFLQLVKDFRSSEYFDDSSMSDISFDKSFIPEDTRRQGREQGRFTSPDAIHIAE